jgi:SAM-dependent methyltransferase
MIKDNHLPTLLEIFFPDPKHPARYSDPLLPILYEMLRGYDAVFDPFAGTGERLLSIRPDAYLNELEPRWAAISQRKTANSYVGDATDLFWPDSAFDAICTSPTYANRMGDTLIDGYKRMTYTACLGEPLQPNNTGALQWGDEYRSIHEKAWAEAKRVLKPGGILVLNIKDHIRNFKRVRVTLWHIYCLQGLGFVVERMERVPIESFGFGQNREARVPYESVILFRNMKER